jgi:hypothetical protein
MKRSFVREILEAINPEIPVIKTRSMVMGINKRIKILAGIETRENTPVK